MRIKARGIILVGMAVFTLAGGIAPATAATESTVSVTSTEQSREVWKTVDFTKGEHLVQPRAIRSSQVYCTPQNLPPGCLPFEPTMSWATPGCDMGAFVLDMTYVNLDRREVPVDTTNGDFTDTATVPAATSAGAGVYHLRFVLAPAQLEVVTGHWEKVLFSRLALRNQIPLC